MASLVQSDIHSDINTEEPTTIGYYIVKYVSSTFILQDDITSGRQGSNAAKLDVQTECLIIMKEKSNWYWEHK